MYVKRIAAVVAAVSFSAALAVGVTPQPAEAAASVSIAGVSKTNAKDIKSKGVIEAPYTDSSGFPDNMAYESTAWSTIYKGKKVVARNVENSTQVKVGVGTYTVKSTARYRTVTTKIVTNWGWGIGVEPTVWDEGCQIRRTSELDSSESDGEIKCTDGRKAVGTIVYENSTKDEITAEWPLNQWGERTSSFHFEADKYYSYNEDYADTYSAWKTVTRTQTVKILNTGYMTYYEYKKIKNKAKTSKVKRIVGGTGKVVDRYSYGKDDYVTREFNGHYIYFLNGKVWAKQW